MVDTQLIRRGIKDPRVIEAMRLVPRHLFVEEALGFKAYDDYPLPIGEKQTISQPYMVAVMCEHLELKGTEKILEIGTGSGYQTAVLSLLAARVYSIERIAPLLFKSRKVIESLGIHNVALKVGDGTIGWKDYAPYDAVIVSAGGPEVPKPLVDQLADGGKLVIPVGGETGQVLETVIKTPTGLRTLENTPCNFVKLVGQYGWPENGTEK
ncbi:MAG: protein-L-isoaspartate(D-aspartate) O-methyltransferase [Nitrospinae bacterium]|nr:protein-L-isoaspartate(D-aspartate) O-methyltransferase [Nitrospinota bacterium]